MKYCKIFLILLIFQNSNAQNYSLSFDGVDDYASLGDIAVDGLSTLTIEAWIKVNSWESYSGIFIKNADNGSEALFLKQGGNIFGGSNDLYLYLRNPGESYAYTNADVISTATWTHIAMVYDGTQSSNATKLIVYINGVQKILSFGGTVPSTTPTNSSSLFLATNSSNHSDIEMDEVRIWNVARTQAQIKSAMYNVDPATSGLVAYYKFNDGTGTTLINSVSGGSNGTLTNGPTWVSSPVQGVNNALNFDGSNDFVTCGDIAIDGLSTMTIEFWVKVNSWATYRAIVSKVNLNVIVSNEGGANDLQFSIDGNSNQYGYTNADVITTSTWTHVAMVFDGTATGNSNRLKVYVNATEIALTFSGTIPSTTTTNSNSLEMGRHSGSEYANINLDEVRIWNTARTASEILNNYNKELPITTSGLIAYYSFNQGIADGTNTGLTTLIDNASTNNGTLTNFDLTTTTNYVAQSASITTLETSTLLPVELKSFTARSQNNNVILNWKTATETNNSGFEVERMNSSLRQANRNWDKVSFVRGSGTSNVEKNYTLTDNNLKNGKYSYRLKQIDLDGTTEYSNTLEVEVGRNKPRIRTNPNPFNNTTIINFEIAEKGEVTIKLYDLLGRVVAEILNNELKEVGEHEVKFNANNLTSGVYLLKFQTNKISAVEKLVLLK